MSKFSAYSLLNDVASAMFSACHEDLPDIEYLAFTPRMAREGKLPQEAPKKKRRPDQHDLDDAIVFTQTWGSTALGFGGIGGASMTTASVVIFRLAQHYVVYFGGRFAYLVSEPNYTFFEDIGKKRMADVANAKFRYTNKQEPAPDGQAVPQ